MLIKLYKGVIAGATLICNSDDAHFDLVNLVVLLLRTYIWIDSLDLQA